MFPRTEKFRSSKATFARDNLSMGQTEANFYESKSGLLSNYRVVSTLQIQSRQVITVTCNHVELPWNKSKLKK